jgi:hypothetical protein
MTIAERRRAKVEEFVRPQLEAGEQIVTTVSHVQTGPTPWFQALFGILFLLWIKYEALVLTDRRVLVIKKSLLSGRPRAISTTYPRNEVKVLDYQVPTVWGKLTLDLGGTPVKLNVHRMNRDQAQQFVDALGGITTAAPPPTH